MDKSVSALLVIDVQQSFEKMPFWSEDGLEPFKNAQNELPSELKSHTAMVLQQRFATVTDTKTFISNPDVLSLNRHCPRSGRPVSSDSIVDYRGYAVGFCNTGCSSDFAANPKTNRMDSLYFDQLIARQAMRAAFG